MSENSMQAAADLLRQARRIAVLTGAGVSKESGVPTFRDAHDGLWAQYDPQQLATPEAFRRDPKLVWDWYTYRRQMVSAAEPNPGHHALAALEKRFPDTRIITQNVDDLHERAGSTAVIHLHGNIARSKCSTNCQATPTYIDISQIEWKADAGPPPCPHCGSHVRPDVVWFGEMLPERALSEAMAISADCDVMLVVGTSGLVTPAASLPGYARDHGARIIEVNPDYTMITRVADLKLDGPSGEILPQVLRVMDQGDV